MRDNAECFIELHRKKAPRKILRPELYAKIYAIICYKVTDFKKEKITKHKILYYLFVNQNSKFWLNSFMMLFSVSSSTFIM